MLTAGESHGKALVAVLEGLPAGVPIPTAAIAEQLARRRQGHGRGGRQKFETDRFEILTGVRHGRSMGSPIAVTIPNLEFEAKYAELMGVEGAMDPADRLTRPRPGHADLAGSQKYGFDDVRNVLERASARETAARVTVGALCRSFLSELGMQLLSHVVQIGRVKAPKRRRPPGPDDLAAIDRVPGPLPRRRRLEGDGGRDRSPAEGSRHGRRRVRGARVRGASGARLLRPLRPEARCATRPCPHEHPVREGGRGRRRVPDRRPARVQGP